MRNGDSYKIKLMQKCGSTVDEICHHFRNKYDPEEVKRFIPGKPEPVKEVSESETPKPTRKKARRRSVAKG